MQTPAAVVFDLGKVLLDFDYNRVAARMLQHCAVSRHDLLRAVNQSPLLYRFETGLLTSQEFFDEIKSLSHFRGDFAQFESIFADIFTPIPEMIDLHTRLRRRGTPTYIFSNTNEIAVQHIRQSYPFFGNFEGYILSYEHRCMKPDPGIYQAVERATGCRGGDILYIDDRLENVQTGEALGWRTIHHSDSKKTIREVEGLLFRG